MLTNLRKICNHPALYTGGGSEEGAAAGGEGAGEQAFDPNQSGERQGRKWQCRLARIV